MGVALDTGAMLRMTVRQGALWARVSGTLTWSLDFGPHVPHILVAREFVYTVLTPIVRLECVGEITTAVLTLPHHWSAMDAECAATCSFLYRDSADRAWVPVTSGSTVRFTPEVARITASRSGEYCVGTLSAEYRRDLQVAVKFEHPQDRRGLSMLRVWVGTARAMDAQHQVAMGERRALAGHGLRAHEELSCMLSVVRDLLPGYIQVPVDAVGTGAHTADLVQFVVPLRRLRPWFLAHYRPRAVAVHIGDEPVVMLPFVIDSGPALGWVDTLGPWAVLVLVTCCVVSVTLWSVPDSVSYGLLTTCVAVIAAGLAGMLFYRHHRLWVPAVQGQLCVCKAACFVCTLATVYVWQVAWAENRIRRSVLTDDRYVLTATSRRLCVSGEQGTRASMV